MTVTAMATVIAIRLVASPQADESDGDESVPMKYEALRSFFEDNPIYEEKEKWEYINPYFEEFPKTDNTSNFHSHATATFENINGKTVTVDTLYRDYMESLNDPNFSCGLLIYQCIQYKIAHPDEEVEISFSALRLSPTLAVCLNPNNRYYGYVRALYDKDYDENGFVRISYLFLEAARLGIDVQIVGSLNSYGTKQYDDKTGNLVKINEPSFVNYFTEGMQYSCYEKYAAGDKVSDHLTVRMVEWAYDDKSGTDLVHVKTCAVSAYRDKYGMDHDYGVWFSSTNLDTANYMGCNANGGSQSGMIITNHKDIYNVTKNFLELTLAHYKQEDIFEFRRIARERAEEQIIATLEGRIDEIPYEERIVYVGSETDDVFEVYFSPLSGDIDTWDTTLNPYCKYVQAFYNSDEDADVVFSFNNPNFTETFLIAHTMVDALEERFINNKRAGNVLSLRCKNADMSNLKKLKSGEDASYIKVKTTHDAVHEKDIIMSYAENGERRYVTLMSSCNFNVSALYYQTNHMIVIKEDDVKGNTVYTSLGSEMSKGGIADKGEGETFSSDERLAMKDKLSALPITVETVVKLNGSGDGKSSYGTLFSNNDYWNLSLAYEINANGNPQAVFGTLYEKNGFQTFKTYTSTFDSINVNTGKKVRLAFVLDVEGKKVECYVDGQCMQIIDVPEAVDLNEDRISVNTFVVGGDHLGSNYNYFRGTMYEFSVWSDARTETEIAAKKVSKSDLEDTSLMAHYKFYGRTPNTFGGDMSAYDNNLESVELWLDESQLAEIPDDQYCFAVVPDTQMMSYWYYKSEGKGDEYNGIENIYNWLLENKDEKNIKYVIGVGDITELSKSVEYENAWKHIQKLSGKIPYSVVMGNHDKYDFQKQGYMPEKMSDLLFNKTFYNDTYLAELDGWYGQKTGDNDVSCSYNAFTVGETKWLLMNLDFGPTDDMLAWAGDIIAAHPDHKVIVATHAYLYRDGSTLDASECYPASGHNEAFNDGDEIYEKLISQYENIELVLCGHDPWDNIVCSKVTAENGNTVTQLLIDSQYIDKYYEPVEMVALLYFSEDGNSMTVRYYSTAKDCYGSVLSQFSITLD